MKFKKKKKKNEILKSTTKNKHQIYLENLSISYLEGKSYISYLIYACNIYIFTVVWEEN